MNGIFIQKKLSQPGRLTRVILLAAGGLFIAVWFLVSAYQTGISARFPDRASVETAIEDQYGIHISMIAVTAGGGVIDFRFQVTDADKATDYMHGAYEDLPVLIVEDTGTWITPRPHTHHVNYEYGRTYYHIYRNPGGAVKPGAFVTVVLGDLRLQHVVVR
ncbi:MAG: hypothetical protein H6659_05500 [Ardenticatenaceae bacterium]|nr:hypothetical protein [Ardenticatenaceae bacterium]